MIWTLFSIFVVLWLIGMVTGNVYGGYLHLLLMIAVAMAIGAVLYDAYLWEKPTNQKRNKNENSL